MYKYWIVTTMYRLKLIYDDTKSQHYKESITHCATIELYVDHGIDSYQMSASRIAFTSELDRMFASVCLSASELYTTVYID